MERRSDHAGLTIVTGTPVGREGAPRSYEEGRTCRDRECTTRLSRYNPDLYCWLHGVPTPRVGRQPRAS